MRANQRRHHHHSASAIGPWFGDAKMTITLLTGRATKATGSGERRSAKHERKIRRLTLARNAGHNIHRDRSQ
jgi:hypothetical protein